MEAFLIFILIAVGWWIFTSIVKGVFSAGKAAVTGQSFTEAYRGLDDFKIRIKEEEETFEDSSEPTKVKRLQMKGLLPISYAAELKAYVIVKDITDREKPKPVISHVDLWQEQFSPCFLQEQSLGFFETDVGFKDWVSFGAVIPKTIQPPKSGNRKLQILFMLMDENYPPDFAAGNILNLDEIKHHIFAFEKLEFNFEFSSKGYEEASKDADKARAITIKIAMAVAMSDGSLDTAEGNAIKNWVKKSISHLSEDRQKSLKKVYNDAIKESYALAKTGSLSLSKSTAALNALNEDGVKYEAMSLCYEVLAADGHATKDELKTVSRIGEALELNTDELSNMRDRALISISSEEASEASAEQILGIDPNWDKLKIKKHLVDQFKKWNARIQALEEGQERANAQKMLDRIAELRKKYG